MGTLAGQVAVITGASRGIGAAITRTLGECGAHVVINYANSSGPAEALADEVRGLGSGSEPLIIQADVTDEAQARGLVERAREHYGRVDILVNNAAITRDRTFRKLTSDDWRRVIDITEPSGN